VFAVVIGVSVEAADAVAHQGRHDFAALGPDFAYAYLGHPGLLGLNRVSETLAD
jgi:hypothetical protein